jgi:hypothetical protein
MLHRQPSSKDRARKSWEAILSLRYFGPAKVVKERVDGGGQQISWHLNCTSQEKAAHGHVVYAVQEVPFWAPFDAVFVTSCPGNERCAVKSLPVRCRTE